MLKSKGVLQLVETAHILVVTTNSTGCKDCVIDGYNGFLVPAKDSKAIAEKLAVLIEDSYLRVEMDRNSRKLAERDFSIENVIARHIEIYNKLYQNCK